ncbi:hypothetical protein K8R47_00715 [archaeon]|nr:hypothetical protein [archaeon]
MALDLSKMKFSNSDLKKEIILPTKLTPELAEETGLHIGDGSMNFYSNKNYYGGLYSLRGHIHDDVRHYDSRIKYLYQKLYNLKLNLRKNKCTGVYGFQEWSDCIVNFKSLILGLPLGKKSNVKIPYSLFNKREYIISVIRGIFDTDGCVYLEPRNKKLYPRIQIGTISFILSEQLKENISKLGFRVTKVVQKRKYENWNTLYVLYIRGDKMFKKWFKLIKPKNQKYQDKYDKYIKQL